jgi:hypothetical protein
MKRPEDLLHGLEPPPPSPELRERVLSLARAAAAERAAGAGPSPVSRLWRRLVDQAWESRGLRLGWASACAVLLAGHWALARSDPDRAAPAPSVTATAEAEALVVAMGIDRTLLSAFQLHALTRSRAEGPRLGDVLGAGAERES